MAEYAQAPNDEGPGSGPAANSKASGSATPASRGVALAALLNLSRELGTLVTPVQPEPHFEGELYRSLLNEARRQQALRLLSLSSPGPEESRTALRWVDFPYGFAGRRWIVGAAALGSAASLVGLLAYVRSRRHSRAA